MRLQKKGRQPKLRAMDVIGREAEPSAEFDFGQLVSEQVEALRQEIKVEEEFFTDHLNQSFVYSLSHIRLLEETLKLDILGVDRERLLTLAQTAQISIREATDIISEQAPATPQAGAIQLFSEARNIIIVDDKTLEAAQQQLMERKLNKNITAFVMMLCVLRPDKKGELAALVLAEDFQEMWDGRRESFKSRMLGFFLGTCAAFLLLHPEERPRFTLGDREKQELIRGIRAGDFPKSQLTTILKNAAIVLGENAEIDERGKIQVTWAKTLVAPEVPLPLRTQV